MCSSADYTDERSPLKRGGFSCFSDTLIGKASGGGHLEGRGVLTGLVAALALGRQAPFGDTELSMELWNVIAGILGSTIGTTCRIVSATQYLF